MNSHMADVTVRLSLRVMVCHKKREIRATTVGVPHIVLSLQEKQIHFNIGVHGAVP